MNLKEQLMTKAVNPKHYKADPANHDWTTPRTWGTYSIPDKFVYGRKKKYRYGNYPVRMREIEDDFGSVELIALIGVGVKLNYRIKSAGHISDLTLVNIDTGKV